MCAVREGDVCFGVESGHSTTVAPAKAGAASGLTPLAGDVAPLRAALALFSAGAFLIVVAGYLAALVAYGRARRA